MAHFNGKVVLITGASGGVGRALWKHFDELGATVIALDKDPGVHELSNATTECAVVDVSNDDEVTATIHAMAEKCGPIDVLVNNAGVGGERTLAKSTPDGWHRGIATNLHSVYYCTSAVLPAMRERKQGAIVMVSSVNGMTTLGSPDYSAAKAAMISFTKFVAVECGRDGVRANAVCPGTIRTPIWQDRLEKNPELFDQLKKWYPLGRVAEPIEVAKAVAFLAGDDATFITGAVLNVDGGLLAGNPIMAAELTNERF